MIDAEFGLFWRYERKSTVGKNKYHKKTLGEKLIFLPALGIAALSSAVILGAAPKSFATGTTDSATALVTVDVSSAISITAEDISIDVNAPSPTGTFATGTGDVTVMTNDVSGYSVYLTSNSTTSTTLDHATLSTPKISSIASSETISGATTKFATSNTWGWSNDGSTFYPIVVKGTKHSSSVTTLYRKTNAPSTAGDTSTLTIGATVDSTLTSGTYSGTLLLTAIPNGNTSVMCDYDSTITCPAP